MKEQLVRTAMLIGEDGIQKLEHSRVAVFGLGGVGGHAAEALARSGVGKIDLIDNDVVSISNINRQIVATHDTVGQLKTEVMKQRILQINPNCKVQAFSCFYLPKNAYDFSLQEYDFILDAIDTVTAKIDLACRSTEYNVPIISCMGTGNKLDPEKLEIADLYKTSICPLAKVMRKECKSRGIRKLTVLYSKEMARRPLSVNGMKEECEKSSKRAVPGSTAFVPAVAGLMMAGYVVRKLTDIE